MTRQTYVPARAPAAGGLMRCAAVFLPAGLPREGRIAFWAPEGELPVDAVAELRADEPGGAEPSTGRSGSTD